MNQERALDGFIEDICADVRVKAAISSLDDIAGKALDDPLLELLRRRTRTELMDDVRAAVWRTDSAAVEALATIQQERLRAVRFKSTAELLDYTTAAIFAVAEIYQFRCRQHMERIAELETTVYDLKHSQIR